MTKILTGYVLRGLALAAVFAFVDGAVGQLEEIAVVAERHCEDEGCASMGETAGCRKKKGLTGKCNCEEKKPGQPREGIADNYYCSYQER